MIKFFLSIFLLIFMPLRLFFFFSIILNIGLVFAISSFISKDNYYESFEHANSIKQRAEKALEKSCTFDAQCSLKIYAKDGNKLTETFYKIANEEKTNKKQSLFAIVKAPIQKLISESDLRKFLKEEEIKNIACMNYEKDAITCSTHQIVAVFRVENCPSCIETFKKEFHAFEKIYYKSFLIKISHKVHNFIIKLFGIKPEEKEIVKEKMKEILYENYETLKNL